MRFLKYFQLVALTLGLLAVGTLIAKDKRLEKLQIFDITAAPTPGDWRYFHQISAAERSKLWDYHAKKRSRSLKDWSWSWRLAWIRHCARSKSEPCGAILKDGLRDRALVVRAESADIIGALYEGSKNTVYTKLLAETYANPRNMRNGKPLYIHERILYALKLIGGKTAMEHGAKLAAKHPDSKTYWKKLTRF